MELRSKEEIGNVGGVYWQKAVPSLVAGFILVSLGVVGCSYPQQRWNNYKRYIKQSIETPLTEGGKCAKRGGLSYGGKCYESSYVDFGKHKCRLRGGLFIEEECFFPEHDRIVVE